MPIYRPPPPKYAPCDGYPHNPNKTLQIIESIWEDIRQRKVTLCATTALVYVERSEYTPTTTVPRRPPGRTFSEKARTLSELRRANLGFDTAEFFPNCLPGVKEITERVLRKQRQFPGAHVAICKRHIGNSPERVPLHPDYSAIFCRQFDAESSHTDEDITLAWMALPFGFSASPAISRYAPILYNEPTIVWGQRTAPGPDGSPSAQKFSSTALFS